MFWLVVLLFLAPFFGSSASVSESVCGPNEVCIYSGFAPAEVPPQQVGKSTEKEKDSSSGFTHRIEEVYKPPSPKASTSPFKPKPASSLSLSSFMCPVRASKGDHFGIRAVHPVTGRRNVPHNGLDLYVDYGTDVKAAQDGKVVYAKGNSGFGYLIIIQHSQNPKVETYYAHLSRFEVRPPDEVKKGQVIAKSGGRPGDPGAGRSTGPHLHFELRINDKPNQGVENIC